MASTVISGGRGLLLMSSKCNQLASRVKTCLSSVKERTCQTLFVYLLRDKEYSTRDEAKCQPQLLRTEDSSNNVTGFSHATRVIYSQASAVCPSIDVRLLLGRRELVGHNSKPQQHDSLVPNGLNLKPVEWILAESCLSRQDVDQFVQLNFSGGSQQGQSTSTSFPTINVVNTVEGSVNDADDYRPDDSVRNTDAIFSSVVLGGTFDGIHNGHKVLLTESAIRCSSELIIGVTDDNMVRKKTLYELIQPTDVRIERVKDFLHDIAPNLTLRVVPIDDPFGPAIMDSHIELIVVSEETIRGANKINEIRIQKNFPPLLIHSIPIFEDTRRENDHEEEKISSSSMRIRLLGHRLAPPLKTPSLPYIIGLTGGIASGKTKLGEYMVEVKGIPAIDCDKLAHEAYRAGTPCFDEVVATFGNDLVNTEGQIDRRVLGTKVFGNPAELKKLTDIVWPEISRLVQQKIEGFVQNGAKIIVVEAAVLVEAGWDSLCHEVWVAFISRDEAITRIQRRDNLPEDRAAQRVDSQISNMARLKKATFAFSSLWDVEFTRKQIEKALADIQLIVDSVTVTSNTSKINQ